MMVYITLFPPTYEDLQFTEEQRIRDERKLTIIHV